MTPPSDTPELTAYALGELQPLQAAEVHDLLAACPAATHELEQIEAVTDALRHGAPIPQERLRPEQRHAVLRPPQLPRRLAPLAPRALPVKPRPGGTTWAVLPGLLKAAAALTLAGTAYFIGRHTDPQPAAGPSLAATPAAVPAPAPVASAPRLLIAQPVPEARDNALPSPPPSPAPAPEKPPVIVHQSSPPAAKAAPTVAAVAPKAAAPAPAAASRPPDAAPRLLALTTPAASQEFVNASRQPDDQFALRPAGIRPRPVQAAKGTQFASPAPAATAVAEPRVKARTPDLYIHSWRAEVASCPWNSSHRLLRVVIQLPADQPAATTQETYPLKVSFDPNRVRQYRQLCERHQPAAELRSAGTHVVWYEFQPNGSLDGSRTVATATLPGAKFTTQTVGPFDSTQLSIQDRGLAWQAAREEFIFDSSVVGFGLLLRGARHAPALDHTLVLKLAEAGKGADASGERARFIRLVTEAKKAAGL